jgi:hypothetical protein
MQKHFDTLKTIRTAALNLINSLSAEELNKVPEGFSNNIIWNMGHVVAALNGLCYRRSSMPMQVSDGYFDRYKPGSKPEAPATEEEIARIKELLTSSIEQLEADYNAGLFKDKPYERVTTRYGVTITSIEDAITFLAFHEGMHIGYVMAMKRVLSISHSLATQ